MSEYEVVAFSPQPGARSKWSQDWLELQKLLLTVPLGKSIRRPFLEKKDQKAFGAAMRAYIKKNKLAELYFVAEPKDAESGMYYVYTGRRKE